MPCSHRVFKKRCKVIVECCPQESTLASQVFAAEGLPENATFSGPATLGTRASSSREGCLHTTDLHFVLFICLPRTFVFFEDLWIKISGLQVVVLVEARVGVSGSRLGTASDYAPRVSFEVTISTAWQECTRRKSNTFVTMPTWARVKIPWPLFLSYSKPYHYFLLVIVLQGNCLILLES